MTPANKDQEQQAARITPYSLLSLGVVVMLVIATWGIASDRQSALARIGVNETRLIRHDKQLDYLAAAMRRVEQALGTKPDEGTGE